MSEPELDLRLQRLLFFYDGVCAIAATLLAVELVFPRAAADLHGDALLLSLLNAWPRVLAFLTSFLWITNFWVANNLYFYHVRRFDIGLMWLTILQLACIVFLPFPTSVVSEHVWEPIAQLFYLGSLLLIALVMVALWWYMSFGHRLVDAGLSAQFIRRTLLRSLGVPMSIVVMMALVAAGVGRFINPLLLTYLLALSYIVLEVLEGRELLLPAQVGEPEAPEEAKQEDSPVEDRREEPDRTTD